MVEFGYTCEKFRVVIYRGEISIIEYSSISDETKNKIKSISNDVDFINSDTVDVYSKLISTLNLIYNGA